MLALGHGGGLRVITDSGAVDLLALVCHAGRGTTVVSVWDCAGHAWRVSTRLHALSWGLRVVTRHACHHPTRRRNCMMASGNSVRICSRNASATSWYRRRWMK